MTRTRLVAVALAAVAVIAAFVTTRDGPEISPDSVTYVTTARHVADGRGLTDFTDEPLTVFGPVFPVLLAGGEGIGIDPVDGGRILNAAVAGTIVLLAFAMLRRHVRSPAVVLGATAFVATSTALLRVESWVGSDALLCALVLGFLLVLDRACETPHQRRVLLGVAAVLVWVAFLARYAGISLLVAGVLTLAVRSAREGVRTTLARAGGFAACAAIGPLLWILRNHAMGVDEVLGPRTATDESVRVLLWRLAKATARLVVPDDIGVTVVAGLVALLVGLIAVAVWPARHELGRAAHRKAPALTATAVFVVVYIVFVAFSRKTAGITLDARLLLPALVPAMVLAAFGVDAGLAALRGGRHRGHAVALASVVLALLVYSVSSFVREIDVGAIHNPRYEIGSASNAQLRGDVRDLEQRADIYSNDPWRIAWTTGREPVQLAPMAFGWEFSSRPATAAAVARSLCSRPAYLVWFRRSPTTIDRGVNALLDEHRFERQRLDDRDDFDLYALEPTTESQRRCQSTVH